MQFLFMKNCHNPVKNFPVITEACINHECLRLPRIMKHLLNFSKSIMVKTDIFYLSISMMKT